MIYNFRLDRSRIGDINERIKRHKIISMGWGGGDTNLDLREKNFVTNTKEFYQLRTTRVANNLKRIKDFKDEDILVTPHLPEYNKVSLLVYTLWTVIFLNVTVTKRTTIRAKIIESN